MDALNERAIMGEGTPESTWRNWFQRYPLAVGHAASLVTGNAAVHVVAPHPDDEILGCAGIIRQLARRDITIWVWAVTDGEASHIGSRRWPPSVLAQTRSRESEHALNLLCGKIRRRRIAIPDGKVTQHERRLATDLAKSFSTGDTVIAPWCLDGHPDHEAVGRASRQAALARDCRFLEVPIWGWHWANPGQGDFPGHRAICIPLDADDCQAKARAIDAFRSQLEPDVDTGNPPVLPTFALIRLQRPFEVVLR